LPTVRDDDVILHRFYDVVREDPDAIYLTQPVGGGRVEHYTRGRALDEAKRMAAYLRALDLPPGSQIAIVSKNCAHFVMSELAIWMAGHVTVALFPTLNAPNVRYILEHSDSRLLFVGKLDDWNEVRQGIPDGLPCVAWPLAPSTPFPTWDDIVRTHDPIPDEPRRAPEDWAMILYTSGSTGQQKGVVHTFASISAPTHSLIRSVHGTREDRYLSFLPLAHAMERWAGECTSLVIGHHLFFTESLETFVEDLKRARPTLFLAVPRLWLKFQLGVFAKMPRQKLDRLLRVPLVSRLVKRKVLRNLGLDQVRFAGSGSAPIPADLLAWYRHLGLELLEGYGMSENFNYSHLTRVGQGRAGYIGHPHDDVECRLGEQGEILVKSPGTMTGYYNAPDLTAEAFTSDGFLRTGDLGEIDEQGRLRITGRLKELFKTSKGKYVAPVPLENLLNSDEHIETSCVFGAGWPATCAVVQLAEHVQATVGDPAARVRVTQEVTALLERMNAAVPGYERLAFIAVARQPWSIEDGLLTPTLKLKRAAIENRYAPQLERWYGSGQRVIWEE
jgi:long-subunit acyl-CoA synthetase (AMP-forming)